MKLGLGYQISDVGGSGVSNGSLLDSQDVTEECPARGFVDGKNLLPGDITGVILQVNKEVLFVGERLQCWRLGAGEFALCVEYQLAHCGSIPASGNVAVEKAFAILT